MEGDSRGRTGRDGIRQTSTSSAFTNPFQNGRRSVDRVAARTASRRTNNELNVNRAAAISENARTVDISRPTTTNVEKSNLHQSRWTERQQPEARLRTSGDHFETIRNNKVFVSRPPEKRPASKEHTADRSKIPQPRRPASVFQNEEYPQPPPLKTASRPPAPFDDRLPQPLKATTAGSSWRTGGQQLPAQSRLQPPSMQVRRLPMPNPAQIRRQSSPELIEDISARAPLFDSENDYYQGDARLLGATSTAAGGQHRQIPQYYDQEASVAPPSGQRTRSDHRGDDSSDAEDDESDGLAIRFAGEFLAYLGTNGYDSSNPQDTDPQVMAQAVGQWMEENVASILRVLEGPTEAETEEDSEDSAETERDSMAEKITAENTAKAIVRGRAWQVELKAVHNGSLTNTSLLCPSCNSIPFSSKRTQYGHYKNQHLEYRSQAKSKKWPWEKDWQSMLDVFNAGVITYDWKVAHGQMTEKDFAEYAREWFPEDDSSESTIETEDSDND